MKTKWKILFALLVFIIITEGAFILYQLQRIKEYSEFRVKIRDYSDYVDYLTSELELERKGLMNDDRGGDFCPACGSKSVAKICYGYYDSETNIWKEELDSKKIVLGGCQVSDGAKRFHCNDCKYEWGSLKYEDNN